MDLEIDERQRRGVTLDNALMKELQEAAERLSVVAQSLGMAPATNAPRAAGPRRPLAPRDMKRLLQLRAQRRRRAFGQFLDWPSWDMLLDLAVVRAEGGHVSVSALCISSGAPQSTALRKLSALEAANLVRRYLHGSDRRRVCVALTDEAAAMVNAMVQEELRFYAEVAD